MCGIIGIAGNNSKEIQDATLASMLQELSCRGPDDTGIEKINGCILGQTRLSIIDLSGGHQPMKDNAQDLTITFNGEIYNYPEIRKSLETKGHVFSTHSDTEVILKAYAEYGERCTEYLDGMFAFAIWDARTDTLFMARDRFGEKPFYYAITDETASAPTLIFASEIKAILATDSVSADIDLVSLDNYLALLCVPPWRTIYKNIHPLEPAHSAIFKDGKLTIRRYWQLKHQPLSISIEDAAARVKELLTDSVKSRMIADVEVGTFLSGGIDSSIITCLAQQTMNENGTHRKVKAFSAGFEDFIDELPYARAAAKIAGTEHYEKQMKTDLLESFITVSSYYDQPFADSSNIPMHLISKFARERVKVVLSGDGGDELFYGYGHHRKHWHLQKHKRLFQRIFSDPFTYFRNHFRTWTPKERAKLWKESKVIEKDPLSHIDFSEAKTPLQKINVVDFYVALPGDMLAKVDTSAMMNSLEVRSPFLNHKLAEFAYNLPEEFKATKKQSKIILQKAFGDILPAGVFTRKKQGFNAPVQHWLRKPEIKNYIDGTLMKNPRIGEFFNVEYIHNMVQKFYAGDSSLQYKIWALLALEMWLRTRKTSLKK